MKSEIRIRILMLTLLMTSVMTMGCFKGRHDHAPKAKINTEQKVSRFFHNDAIYILYFSVPLFESHKAKWA